jgi:hypothetical protein
VAHEEPKQPGKGVLGAGNYGGIQNVGEPTGKSGQPEHAQGGKKYGRPRVAGKPPGKSRPATGRPDHAKEKGFDGKPGKVTLCHKGRVTTSVGAPAKPRAPEPRRQTRCRVLLAFTARCGAEPVTTRAWTSGSPRGSLVRYGCFRGTDPL